MPILAPILGNPIVSVGLTTQLSCATVGGAWSSDNTAIATVVAGTGVVTGVAQGYTNIIYTVGADSIAVTLTVSTKTLSNGFDVNAVYNALKERVKWRFLGGSSQSMRYFEDFHTLADPQALLDMGQVTDVTLPAYLEEISKSQILEIVNTVYNFPAVINPAALSFYRGDWMLYPQPVANTNQFVGLRVIMAQGDYAIKMNSVELFFDTDCTFNMYLYNDMTLPPLYTIEVTAQAYNQTIVDLSNDAILNYLSNTVNKGGIWYFGYYQADIEAQGAKALFYSVATQSFNPCRVWAYSAPLWLDSPIGGRNFRRNVIGSNNLTYGLNLEITTYNDGTNNIIRNAHLFDEVIGLSVAAKCIEAMVFSYRTNVTERNIQNIPSLDKLYNELNLARPSDDLPFSVGLRKQIERAVWQAKQAFQPKVTITTGIS